jgi:serine phosphatase RsbU (regulator of sigma subunit)
MSTPGANEPNLPAITEALEQQRRLSGELAERIEARTDELEALSAIAGEMVLRQPLATLLDRVLARVLPLLDAAAGNVRLYDRDQGSLRLLAQRDIPPDDPRAAPVVPVDGSRLGSIVRDNRPLVVERDLALQAFYKTPSRFESLLGVPLRIGEQVIGSMVLLDTRPRSYNAQQIDLAQLVGNQIAIAIENTHLLEQRERQIQELVAIGAISHAANTSLDLRMLLAQVHAALNNLMPLDAFVMTVYDPERDLILEGIGIDEGQTYEYFAPNETPEAGTFTAWVLRNRRTLHLRDVAADMAQYPELLNIMGGSGRPAASWLGVPLFRRDDQVIGTIVVQSYTPNAYDERDERLLQNVAQQAALQVQNLTLMRERERQIRELDAIGRIGALVSASFDLERMLEIVYEVLQQATSAAAFYMVICEPASLVVTQAFYIERGRRFDDDWPGAVPPPSSLTGWILHHRRALLFGDLLAERERLEQLGIAPVLMDNTVKPRAWIGVPLLAEDAAPIGVISVQHDQPGVYDERTLEFLTQVGNHLSLGVQKIRLFQEREQQLRENARLFAAEHAARRTADTLREVARVLGSTFDAGEVLDLILDQLRGVIAYDSASIMLVDGDVLRAAAQRGLDDGDLLHRMPLSLRSKSGAGMAVLRRAPVVIDDTLASGDWQKTAFGTNIRSWLGVPLISKGTVLGTLNIDSHEPNHFSLRHVEVALAFANHAALALENAQLYQESVTRVERELEIARRIQSNLFPRQLPQPPGITLAARACPARETGGDFYDVVALGAGRVGILVGDASGKSIPGAMLMAIAHSIARSEAHDHEEPETVMRETNRWVTQDVPARAFVALSYASVAAGARHMALANAGQLAPLRRRADGTVEYLEAPGPTLPLGIRGDIEYQALDVPLAPGDTLVFFTDGIVEAHNPARELFGFERLEALLRDNGAQPPAELIETLFAAVVAFAAGTTQHDDMTLLVLRVDE